MRNRAKGIHRTRITAPINHQMASSATAELKFNAQLPEAVDAASSEERRLKCMRLHARAARDEREPRHLSRAMVEATAAAVAKPGPQPKGLANTLDLLALASSGKLTGGVLKRVNDKKAFAAAILAKWPADVESILA